MKDDSLQDIIIVTGPTASGKSDHAVNLALDIGLGKSLLTNYIKKECAIISADSRQVYVGLDIGSGKITKSEMKEVVHYGLGVAQPIETFTAADWLKYAEEKIIEITNENKIPIICGGTGLYIDALLYGLTDNPAPDFAFRKEYENKTLLEIQNNIKSINLEFFNNLNNSEQNNKARLIRKLEVLKLSNNKTNLEHNRELKYNILEFIILNPELNILEEKIKLRLENRLKVNPENPNKESDLVLEVRNLLEKNIYTKERLLSFGLEYKYVTMYIMSEITYENMRVNIILKSMQYAKRQISWNKRYADIKNLKFI
jgi:tRNA dimethylallyltransferase